MVKHRVHDPDEQYEGQCDQRLAKDPRICEGDSGRDIGVAVDKRRSLVINLLGFLGGRKHHHIGKDIIAVHNPHITQAAIVRIDYELLTEELTAVGTFAMGAYRQDVVAKHLPLAVIFAATHENLGIKHRGRRMDNHPGV